MNQCIITGCAVYDEQQERAAWCDLFKIPGYYIAHLAGNGSFPAWTHDAKVTDSQKVLSFNCPLRMDYFEKDRVLVIPEQYATLNQTAQDYIAGGPR